MHRLFGSSKPTGPAVSITEATEGVSKRAEHLDAQVRKLDQELATYRDQLAKARTPSQQQAIKKRALMALQKKKMYEGQRDQLMQQSFSMEQVNFGIQTMKDTLTTVSAMKQANATMKTTMKAVSLDDIEDIYDDLEDLMDTQNEMQAIMARSYAVPDDIDDETLELELASLGEFEAEEELPSYLSAGMPSVASSTTAESQIDDFGLPSVPTVQHASSPAVGQQLHGF